MTSQVAGAMAGISRMFSGALKVWELNSSCNNRTYFGEKCNQCRRNNPTDGICMKLQAYR